MEGILLIDKPILYTSHDVVDVVRRKLKIRRVGHAGSLDPMANGLVVCLVGKATSLFSRFVDDEKTYEGMLTLGLQTDTQDLEGRIIAEHAVGIEIDRAAVERVFAQFIGSSTQTISRYSSAKINGRKCYDLARKNEAFSPPTKQIEIKRLQVEAMNLPDIYFSAQVSKGTYIRAVCEDVGEALGAKAVLSALRRTRCGDLDVRSSLTISQLKRMTLAEIAGCMQRMTPAAV